MFLKVKKYSFYDIILYYYYIIYNIMGSKNEFQNNMNELKKSSKFKIKKNIFNKGFNYKTEIENISNTQSPNEIKQKLKNLLEKCINDQKIVAGYKISNADKTKYLLFISHLKT